MDGDIFIDKLGRIYIVAPNSANLCGCQKHEIRLFLLKKGLHLALPNQIKLPMGPRNDIGVAFHSKFANNRRSHQTPVSSNTVQTTVDELLDVVVVDDSGGPVAVSVGETGAVLQFTITNNGNGSEVFRIVADDAVNEGGFDPALNQLYLESNALPGLQAKLAAFEPDA